MLKNYLKIAWRNLWRNRVYTAINILGLALGITCSIVIYVFLRYELTFDAFHSKSDRTYRIVEHNQTANGIQYRNTTAYPLAEAIRYDLPELEVAQAAGPLQGVISFKNENGQVSRFEEDRILYTDPYYFQLFDFNKTGGLWIVGDSRTAFKHPNSVVLTQELVDRYFPSAERYESVVGKTLTLNDQNILTVTGVIRNPPKNTNLLFDMLIPYQFFKNNHAFEADNWSGNYQGTTFVTLPKSQKVPETERRINSLKRKYIKSEDAARITYLLQPLKEIHTEALYGNSIGSYMIGKDILWSLGSLATFLIIIACFNFINLTTALTVKRIKEVGIRKTAGSTKLQLIAQFMSETLLITLTAMLLSVISANLILNFLNQSVNIITIDLKPDYTVSLFILALIIGITLLAGLYPALSLSKYTPLAALKNSINYKKQIGLSFRQGLIVLQFSIAYLLIAGTFVIARQMYFIQNKNLGFTRDAIITMPVPPQESGKLEVFRERLLQSPSIKNVSYSSGAPTTTLRQYGTNFRLDHQPASMMRNAEMKIVDLQYLECYDLHLIAGNWLSEPNKIQGFNGFIVNEALVKSLGLNPREAIGKSIIINEGEAPIIGVVKDFHNNSLQEKISPCLMFYWGMTNFFDVASVQFQANTSKSNIQAALGYVEKTWKGIFPEGIYKYEFVNDYLGRNYLVENFFFDAFKILSAIAILISCLGLFGLTIFTAQQRTKEIGIRKVLGASVAGLAALLSKDFVKLVLIAILIATPLAWYAMNRWLEDFAYRIELQWWMFTLAGILAVVIAVLTVSFQSVRAALTNPVKSLRSE